MLSNSKRGYQAFSSTFAITMCLGLGIWVAAPSLQGVSAEESFSQRLLNSDKEPGNWLHHHKDYSGQRFSKLSQINRGNVANLKVAWTVQLGGLEGGGGWNNGGLEGTPLAENGFLYVTDGWGSVYKVDARKGAGKLVWKMDPKTDHDWAGTIACCGINNRGAALWGDLVISHTLDGRLIATNKETGDIAWQKPVADPNKGETLTAAPLIVKDMVITGVAGGEFGIRGWVAATNLKTHEEVWRSYTIPKTGEPGSETWKDEHNAAATGGGATWVTGTYDPTSNTIVWGTGNPGPDWDNGFRPGDNLYTDSSIALDADTGKIKWHFQHTPNDVFDYDSVAENVLVDTTVNGKPAKLALEADRNGFAYAIDRTNGKFLWATPFVKKMTWTKGLNSTTGLPVEYDPAKPVQRYIATISPGPGNPETTVCPGNMGGKNWPPTAYNPTLQLWYIPVIESCANMKYEKQEVGKQHVSREWFIGGGPASPNRITGSITAIDVTKGTIAAKLETPFPLQGGMLATPELVFTAMPSGEVAAYDAKTLKELWKFSTGGGITAPPMTFTADGRQYVAVLVGFGGAWPRWNLDSTPELKLIQPSSTLYVFAL